jgi:hypothetical protein
MIPYRQQDKPAKLGMNICYGNTGFTECLQCSADYNVESETTKQFFATVQNKLHWAITRETAAEIV